MVKVLDIGGVRSRIYVAGLSETPEHPDHDVHVETVNLDTTLAPDWYCDAIDLEPVPDGVFDWVSASHLIEHISTTRLPGALRNWLRVLKPGGGLSLQLPDFEFELQAQLKSYDPGRINVLLSSIYGWTSWMAAEWGDDSGRPPEWYTHHNIFWFEKLKYDLEEAGFVDVKRLHHCEPGAAWEWDLPQPLTGERLLANVMCVSARRPG